MNLKTRVFRAHHPGWAFAPASGEGAALRGGRFNPVGRPALYTSINQQGAWMEAQQSFPFKAQPVSICVYEVDCNDIEDLCDPGARKRLDVTMSDLFCAWEDLASRGQTPPSWDLTERLIAMGIAGIIVPSFAPGATHAMRNLVFWNWSEEPSHQVRGPLRDSHW